MPVEAFLPALIPSPIFGLGPEGPREGEADLKIELLTRLLCRTCLKLELVLLGPSDACVRAGEPESEEASVEGRVVFNGAHPFVDVEMIDARSLSSNRRAVEGDEVGEKTLSALCGLEGESMVCGGCLERVERQSTLMLGSGLGIGTYEC